MLITIESLRQRIGLPVGDASKDAEIMMISEVAVSFIETYCDRKFFEEDDKEVFTHKSGYTVSLRRYPIDDIQSVTGVDRTVINNYHVDKKTGLMQFDGHMKSHQFTVSYKGGYTPTTVPSDLLWCIMSTFDALWADHLAVGGGAVAASTGGVKQAKIGDMSITYDVGGGGSSIGSVGGAYGPISTASLSVLSKYKRWSA